MSRYRTVLALQTVYFFSPILVIFESHNIVLCCSYHWNDTRMALLDRIMDGELDTLRLQGRK